MNIIVLGAGVIGVSTAYFLARAGAKVTVIDKNSDSSLGCSFANGGQLSYSHIEPWSEKSISTFFLSFLKKDFYASFSDFSNKDFYCWLKEFYRNSFNEVAYENSKKLFAICLQSRKAMHQIIKKESLDFQYQQKGILHFYRTPKQFNHAVKKLAYYQKLNRKYSIFNANQCLQYEPMLDRLQNKLAGGILFEQDESGDARLFTQNLTKICQQKYKVDFIYNAEIFNLLNNHKKITGINTSKGVLVADAYVYALGANNLLSGIKIDSKIYPIKGYSLSIPCDNANFKAPNSTITDNCNKIVFSRIGDTFRVAGTIEMSGFDLKINKKHLDFLYKNTKNTFSNCGNMQNAQEWCGFRPFRPSGLPIIEKNQQYSNLFINSGHGSLGWTLACGSAKIISKIILEK